VIDKLTLSVGVVCNSTKRLKMSRSNGTTVLWRIAAITIIAIISNSNGSGGNGVMAWPNFGPGFELHLNTSDFAIDCIGRCPYDIVKPLAARLGPAYVLMGGAVTPSAGLEQMVELNNGGDFLIIRLANSGPLPLDRYNSLVYSFTPTPNSVTTISIKTAAATQHPYVLTRLADAESIFFPGLCFETYPNTIGLMV
jgi:hypothetical protein